jgi:hypothetical protein
MSRALCASAFAVGPRLSAGRLGVGVGVCARCHGSGLVDPAESQPPLVKGGSSLGGVSGVSPSGCTAVGRYNDEGIQVPTAERWDGVSWSVRPVPSPAGTSGSDLPDVAYASPTACTAVADYFEGIGSREDRFTLVGCWDGVAWSIQATPHPAELTWSVPSRVSCPSATGHRRSRPRDLGAERHPDHVLRGRYSSTPTPRRATLWLSGKGTARPEHLREPKQSWRRPGPSTPGRARSRHAPSLPDPDSEQAPSR